MDIESGEEEAAAAADVGASSCQAAVTSPIRQLNEAKSGTTHRESCQQSGDKIGDFASKISLKSLRSGVPLSCHLEGRSNHRSFVVVVREETLRALAASWRELCGEFRVVVREESFRLRWGQDRLSSSREKKTPKSMFYMTVPYTANLSLCQLPS